MQLDSPFFVHTHLLNQCLYDYIKLFLHMICILLYSYLYEIVTFKGHFTPSRLVFSIQYKKGKIKLSPIHADAFISHRGLPLRSNQEEKILCSQQNIQCTSVSCQVPQICMRGWLKTLAIGFKKENKQWEYKIINNCPFHSKVQTSLLQW